MDEFSFVDEKSFLDENLFVNESFSWMNFNLG